MKKNEKETKRKVRRKKNINTTLSLAEQNKQVKVKVARSCPTLGDPVDYTIHGILQARMLEWVALPFSRGSSQPRDRTQVSCRRTAGRFFTSWATREARWMWSLCSVKQYIGTMKQFEHGSLNIIDGQWFMEIIWCLGAQQVGIDTWWGGTQVRSCLNTSSRGSE